jgi:hypothetical protein
MSLYRYKYRTDKMLHLQLRSSRTGCLERKLQMLKLSATRRSWIAILKVSLVIFAAITLCVASEQAIPKVSVNFFVIDSVRKLLDTPSHISPLLFNLASGRATTDTEFPTEILCTFNYFQPIPATCLAHPDLVRTTGDFIWRSSLCSSLKYPLSSPLLGPNILSMLFWKPL